MANSNVHKVARLARHLHAANVERPGPPELA